jgi:Cellulase (glycosyl hydrolase family 5)/Glycosyl transferase family 2
MTILDETSASAFRYTPPKRLQSLSFTVLAGDTVQNVEAAISEAIEVASAVADHCEIVVVDVSTTKFVETVVQRLASNHDIPIRLTRYGHNAGYGENVRHAWLAGHSEWVAFTDAEYQFRLGDLADFIPLTDHADVITGWRRNRHHSLLRSSGTHLFNVAARVLFRTGVKDANCAFVLLRSSTVRQLELTATTAMVNTELIYQARRHGFDVAESPVTSHQQASQAIGRGEGKRASQVIREFVALRRQLNARTQNRLRLNCWLVGLLALFSGIASTVWASATHTVLAYGDAEAHLNISKRVVGGLTAGLAQLGSVWLPLPHLLMTPFVVNDHLWRTGLAGAAIGVPALVLAAVMSYRTSYLLTNSIAASWLAPVVIIANPNTLYLSATPMTELLLLSMVASSLYFLCNWVFNDGVNNLVLAAAFASLATLSRYDGWMLVLIEAVVVLIVAAFRHRARAGVEGLCVLFGVLAFTGIGAWLLWNQLIFSDAFYFAESVYGSAEQQQFFLRNGLLPTYHDLDKSVIYWFEDVRIIAGTAVGLLAAFGLAILVVTSIRQRRLGPVLIAAVALSCFAFYILSLYLGQASLILPRFAAPDAPFEMSNLRYGLQALLPVGIFIAYLASRRPRVLVPILVAVVVAQGAFFVGSNQVMAYRDGTAGLSSQRVSKGPDSPVVEEWLRRNYDGGLVLMDDYRRPVGPVETGIRMNSFIGVGNKPFWRESLGNPAQHAQWIILQQADTDAVWRGFSPQSRAILADHFVQVFRSGEVKVYKRRPSVDDTVRKVGQHLYLDGARWNSVGVNSYDLLEQPLSVIEERLTGVAGSGYNTVRTWCFDRDGGLSDDTLTKLATLLNSARERGVRVICTIGNTLSDFGGQSYFTPQGEDFFASPRARGLFGDQIRKLLNYRDEKGVRLADQQAILAWDLLNEPRPNPDTPEGAVAEWTDEMAALVSSLDQRHLVTIGTEGFIPGYPYDPNLVGRPGAEFETLCRIPSITLCSVHLYPKYLRDSRSSDDLGVIAQQWREAADRSSKPVLLEEVGYSSRDAGSFTVRQEFYDNVARAINNSDLDGGLLWNLGSVVDHEFTLQYGDPDSDRTLSAWATLIAKSK